MRQLSRWVFRPGSAVIVASIAALAIAPASLVAQPGGVTSACDIDPNSPKDLALISVKFQQVRGQTDPEKRKASLVSIMKDLDTKPERFEKNPVGYQYMKSQVLSMLAMEPDIGFMPTRGAIGVSGDPAARYDLVAHLDSSFSGIAAGAPTCAGDVEQLRQNDAWLALTRKALDASNAGQLDSANHYAMQSMRLSSTNPYPHYVMANVANARGDKKAAVGHWKAVVKTAGTDTSYTELKNSSTYYIAVTQLEQAEALSGAERQAAAREAAANFNELITSNPSGSDTPNILSSIADAMTLAGDSLQLPTVYAPMLQAPDKYDDFALAMGGVLATRANRIDDAQKLFEGAVKQNPYSRDALRNLAATYYAKEDFNNMFDPATKLVAIDPNNFEGWMLFAYAAQGIALGTKDPAVKKTWTDSLVKYRTIADGLPAKVEVTSFMRAKDNASLVLTLEQQATAAGTYSVTAEFLDKSGAVVGTDTQSVGPIEKGKKAQVTLKTTSPGVYGYRYKPIK